MTLPATTWLAADAALPQRDALLDTRVVADRIGSLIDKDSPVMVERCDRLRVNYQIGKSLRVLHRVGAEDRSWTISARAYRDGRGERAYEEAQAAARFDACERSVLFDPTLNTVFWIFPHDRKIAGLAAIAAGRLPDRQPLPCIWQSTRLVAYAPEKSATLACLDESGAVVAYAKVSAQTQTEQDHRLYRRLCESVDGASYLRLPRALAYLPHYRLLLIEAVAGRRMDDPAGGAHALGDAGRLGAALATFHTLAPGDAPQFTRFAADRLREVCRLVVLIRPDVETLAHALVSELIAGRPVEGEPPVCLHGDVHPKNAIVTDRHVALIDIEDLGIGPAAADVASFLAALVYLRRGGQITGDAYNALSRAFLAGYRSIRPLPARASLRWHTAAALLIERIFRAVSRVRPLGLVHLPELLNDARALLRERQS